MATPVIAPSVPSYAYYTSYITGQDFLNEPTGVDVSQLIPQGSNLSEQAALARLVANASSEADRICQKVLAATLDVVTGQYRIQRDGTIRVPVPYSPLISVNAVSVGTVAGNMTALTDLSGVWLQRNVAWIPVPGSLLLGSFTSGFSGASARPGWVFAQVSYVNGWAHSTLSASTLAGASSIAPVNVLGFVPGLPFTVYDGQSTEGAQVASSYVVGSATVPLAAPLTFAHGKGVTVSALPPFARQAVVRLSAWLVKTRGSEAIVLDSITGQPSRTQQIDPGGNPDYAEAERALMPLTRVR